MIWDGTDACWVIYSGARKVVYKRQSLQFKKVLAFWKNKVFLDWDIISCFHKDIFILQEKSTPQKKKKNFSDQCFINIRISNHTVDSMLTDPNSTAGEPADVSHTMDSVFFSFMTSSETSLVKTKQTTPWFLMDLLTFS